MTGRTGRGRAARGAVALAVTAVVAAGLSGCGDDAPDAGALPSGLPTDASGNPVLPTDHPSVGNGTDSTGSPVASGSPGADASGTPTGDPARTVEDPCRALPAAAVAAVVGHPVEARSGQTGSLSNRTCYYTPSDDSTAELVVGSQWTDADFDEVWGSIADKIEGDVETPRIPGADGARVVVDAGAKSVLLTGFVRHADQVDTVNVYADAPYDEKAQLAQVVDLLRRLAR